MDSDLLRMILLAIGVALVAGIYFIDRAKRQTAKRASFEFAPRDLPEPELGDPEAFGELGAGIDDDPPGYRGPLPPPPEPRRPPPARPGWLSRWFAPKPKSKSRDARRAGLEATDPNEDLSEDPSDRHPTLVLQLNLAAPADAWFQGEDLQNAMDEVGLEGGDMNIFHRIRRGSGRPKTLFSIASMVKPGWFPLDDMSRFSTPGLTFFAQLPGPEDGITVLSEMLSAAHDLHRLLGGELQDGSHSALTRQTIEHMRTQILEHRRRVQLAHRRP